MIPEREIPILDDNKEERNGNKYKVACKKLGVIPVSHIIRKLSHKEIRICGYGLGSKGTKALAVALVVSLQYTFSLYYFIHCTVCSAVEMHKD